VKIPGQFAPNLPSVGDRVCLRVGTAQAGNSRAAAGVGGLLRNHELSGGGINPRALISR